MFVVEVVYSMTTRNKTFLANFFFINNNYHDNIMIVVVVDIYVTQTMICISSYYIYIAAQAMVM